MYNNTAMNPYPTQEAYQPRDDEIKSLCQRYMNYHVIAHASDGSQFEGIIIDMDGDGISMLVSEWVDGERGDNMTDRQFGYGFGRRRFRRFFPRRFPFFFFRRPFFRPFPYYF
ncbi:MAG TPA: hypothetical protein VFK33_11930 [Bacillales bacterium]|nr:hypothetical protein [Bacillales bacterium]